MIRLTYVYDTLCGWCFIARPEILKLRDSLPPETAFRTLHAHLFTTDTPFPINDQTRAMVREAGQTIGPQKTGARMSDAYVSFLETPGLIYDSGLSARAAAVAEQLDGAKSFEFGMAYQRTIFEDGTDFRDIDAAIRVWSSIGGNAAEMRAMLTGPDALAIQQARKNDAHALLSRAGARGTPALILDHDGHVSLLDPFDAKHTLDALATRWTVGCNAPRPTLWRKADLSAEPSLAHVTAIATRVESCR